MAHPIILLNAAAFHLEMPAMEMEQVLRDGKEVLPGTVRQRILMMVIGGKMGLKER
jgi:hypothetical protein